MFKTHYNKQYEIIAEGDFCNILVKKPRYEKTTTYFGTKEDAIEKGIFKSGSSSFYFVNGFDTPIIDGYMSQLATQPKFECKTGAMSKAQWDEFKEYMDNLYSKHI
jgi:hypothetical protein